MRREDTRLVTITRINESLIEFRFKLDDYKVDVDHQLEFQVALGRIVDDSETPYGLMVIPGKYGGITKEAREMEVFEMKHYKACKGLAIVTSAMHTRLLGTIFMTKKRTKAKFPHRFFKTEEAAIKWLNELPPIG